MRPASQPLHSRVLNDRHNWPSRLTCLLQRCCWLAALFDRHKWFSAKACQIDWHIHTHTFRLPLIVYSSFFATYLTLKRKTYARNLATYFFSSSNWPSRGWSGRNWAAATHRIARKAKNTSSSARPHCMRTQSWTSSTNFMRTHCYRTTMWCCSVPWSWTPRCVWYCRCRFGRNALFIFRWVLGAFHTSDLTIPVTLPKTMHTR